MKLILALASVTVCCLGEPAKAQYYSDPYYGQDPHAEVEELRRDFESLQREVQSEIDSLNFNQPQTIYQPTF